MTGGPFGGLLTDRVWGLVVVAALFLAAAGAAWRARVPGGVTTDERRAHRVEHRRAMRVLGWLMWLAPWIVAAAAARFVDPYRPARTVVLVSRSRVEAPSGAPDPWSARVAELTAGLRDQRVLDAGNVVATILERLQKQGPHTGFGAGDPASEEVVATALRSALIDDDIEPAVVDGAAVAIPNDIRTVAGPLPRWVVESVEISVLRALTRRYRVEKVHAVVSGRRSAVGPVWGAIESFLEASEGAGPTGIDAHIYPVQEQPPVMLRSVLHAQKNPPDRCSGGIEVQFAMIVDSCTATAVACGTEIGVGLALYQGGVQQLTAMTTISVAVGRDSRVERRTVCFHPSSGGRFDAADLRTIDLRTSQPDVQSVPLVASTARAETVAAGQVRLRILSPPADRARWSNAAAIIREADADKTSTAVAAWQTRANTLGFNVLGKRGGEPLTVDVKNCGNNDAASSDVTLDACGDGIWIYPNAFRGSRKSTDVSPIKNKEVLRVRSTWSGLPGSDSWNGLGILHGKLWRPTDRGFTRLAEATVLSTELRQASFANQERLVPVVSRLPGDSTVTFFGFDPREQGAFFNEDRFDPERFLAIWTHFIEATYAAAAGPDRRWSTVGADDQPYCLLNAADLAQISGRGLWAPFVLLLLGMLLHIAMILLGLRSVPPASIGSSTRRIDRPALPPS